MGRRRISSALVASLMISALAAASVPAEGMTREEKIAAALKAAPESIGKDATIMDIDGTILRQGTNGWTCMPASGPGSTHPICADAVWMKLFDAFGRKAAFTTDRIGISYMLAGDDNVNNADPFDSKQDPGEVWVQEGPHLMIIAPDPRMLEGISDDPNNGGPYVMWKGTPYAHIMVPVGPRK